MTAMLLFLFAGSFLWAEPSADSVRLFAHGAVGFASAVESTFAYEYDEDYTKVATFKMEPVGISPVGMIGLDVDWRPSLLSGMAYVHAFGDYSFAQINRTAQIMGNQYNGSTDTTWFGPTDEDISLQTSIVTYGIGIGGTFLPTDFVYMSDGGTTGSVTTDYRFRIGGMFGGAFTDVRARSSADLAEKLIPGSTHNLFLGIKLNMVPLRFTANHSVAYDVDFRFVRHRITSTDETEFPLNKTTLITFGAIVRLM